MAPPSHNFTRLPVDDEEESLRPEAAAALASNASHDDILDGLLTKVGYGTFQRRLLVNSYRK